MKKIKAKSKRFLRSIRSGKRPYALAGFSILLALGVLVLIRSGSVHAHGQSFSALGPISKVGATTTPLSTSPETGTSSTSSASNAGLSTTFGLSQSMIPAGASEKIFAELIVKGDESEKGARVPSSIAVVLDHSGSMSGIKLQEAKKALQLMVERMQNDDHIAVIIYDDQAEVRLPLTRVGDVRGRIGSIIASINEGGGTNIPAGLELGLQSLTGSPSNAAKRLVLFSDGLDGSGRPLSSVEGSVRSFASQGTTVSALGIGTDYDEAYMSKVANAGSGNYGFLANEQMLQRFVKLELDETANTIADQVLATLTLPEGTTLSRVVGATATGAVINFGPIAAGAERRAVLEFDVTGPAAGTSREFAYKLDFRSVKDGEAHQIAPSPVAVLASGDSSAIAASRNVEIWSNATAAFVDLDQEQAIKAWESGDADKAREITRNNMAVLGRLERDRREANLAPSAAVALQQAEFAKDEEAFDQAPESKAGRAFKKFSGAKRKARSKVSARRAGEGYAADDPLGALDF